MPECGLLFSLSTLKEMLFVIRLYPFQYIEKMDTFFALLIGKAPAKEELNLDVADSVNKKCTETNKDQKGCE